MNDPVRAIADAVLYEGYLLWPYRRSAQKNRQRWTFGCIMPPAWSAAHPDEVATTGTELLIEGCDDAEVDVTLRFLQVVRRQVLDPVGRAVDELEVDGERYLSWEEAVEREITTPGSFVVEEETHRELLAGGSIERSSRSLRGRIEVTYQPVGPGVQRARVTVSNLTNAALPLDTTPATSSGALRMLAVEDAFCSAHLILRARGGRFISPLDPRSTTHCSRRSLWPVLVGTAPDRSTVLAAAIMLDEYPQVAPESPGDLFDGGEVDQLLTLNILAMTDAEKAEMRATDMRARTILERTDAMRGADLMRLHGTIRDLQPAERS